MTDCNYEFTHLFCEDKDVRIELTVDNTEVVIKTIHGAASLSHEDFKEVYKKFEAVLKQVEPLLDDQR